MSGTRLAYYVAGGALSLGAPAYTAKAQSACPTVISGTPLSSPIIVPDGTPAASIDLAINRDILVSSGAVVTSSLAALAVPDQAGAYAIDAAGGNAIIVCGTVGLGPDPFTLPGGGIRAGSGSRVLVTDGGTIFGSRNGPATAPAIELLGPGSGITVDAGGQILGGFAPAVRADAPVAITNNGTIAVTGGEGFETAAIDLTGGVGSIITNTGTISSTSFPAIRFRDARGVAGGVTQIINSGRISGGTRFPGGNDGIELRRGLTSIINSGTIDIITVGTAADSDGFNPASGLTLINQAGYIGPIIITPPNPGFSPDLAYDLTLTNAAGATIGSVPGVRFNTSLPLGTSFVGVTHQEAGQLRITNAGVIEGLYNGVRFASGDTVITNAAGASIRTPDENLSFPAANEGYAIYGNPTINIGAARPLIDNGGTIFGLFGGVNTGTVDATVINRSVRDSSGIVIGGGSIGGGASGVTIGGGSIINEAGATIFSAAVRAPGDAGCITRRESFGVTCTSLLNTIFFTNPAMVGSLDNSGTITSRSRQTLLSFSPLALHNRSTGLIESLGASGPAIDAVSGLAADFVNEGVIRASGTVVQITGTSGASFGHDIINRGAITGVNGGTALITNGSSARFVNELGAVVSGGVVLQGVQNIPNGAGTSPTSGSVLNSGTINGALLFGTGGDLVNQSTGSIVATSTSSAAVSSALSNNAVNSFLNVTNGGFISGVARAIQSVGSRVRVNITNLTGGSIISTDSSNVFGRGNGIDVGGTLSLVNQIGAQIIGSPGSSGVVAAQATDFFNAGTISGGAFGVQISDFLAAPSGEIIFRNSGTITGTALSGVQTFISGNIRFENSGLISGGSAGLTVTGSPARSVAISSSGSITSSLGHGVNLAGGSLTGFENSGSIVAAQNGLNLRNIANAAIINQTGGLIDTRSSGNGWAGIAVFGGSGTIVNQAGATISASAGTNEGGESAIFIGANAGLVRVENDGVLSGVLTFYGENATDLVNRGSILATQVSDGDAVNILLGGVFRNEAGASVTATRDAIYVFDNDDNGTITDIHNAAGAVITGDSDGDGIGLAISADDSNQAVSGVERVFNAGTIMGGISLGLNDDRLDLTTTGTISGASSGGAGVDSLRIDTTTGATRTLAEGQFAAFEDIVLNPTAGAAGRYVVTAAGDPLTTATLDAGLVGSSITLAQGELSLRDTASSVRAETVSTAAGTLLSGNGIVFGDTSVAGTIAPGNSVGHLTVEGDLTLAPTALLAFELGAANIVGGQFNDLITVNGSLVLDGLLTVAQSVGGNLTGGVYRLINFSGSLTDNMLEIAGALPNGLVGTIQTGVAGQVNLVIAGASTTNDIDYWDGPNFTAGNIVGGRGGTAIWNAANTNWTTQSGNANGPWDQRIGVFGGQTGIVTVEGSQAFAGLQFVTDGYHLVTGIDGALDLGTGGFIFVDSGLDTRISVGINGDGILDKQGDGRLLLDGLSSYAGGTTVTAGTLAVGSNTALGAGKVDLAAGTTLQAAADLTLDNIVSVDAPGAALVTIDTQSFALALSSAIVGGADDSIRKIGNGTLALSAGGSFGGIRLAAGTLDVGGALTVPFGIAAATDTTVIIGPSATATSQLASLSASGQRGAFAIDGAGRNSITIAGEIGISPGGSLLSGGGIRTGPDSQILVTQSGIVRGNRNASLVAPAIDFLGTGLNLTVAAGGQVLGGLAPSIRGNAPILLGNAGVIASTGTAGSPAAAVDLTGGVGSILTNSGMITSGSTAAIVLRNARGTADGVTQITNSGTIRGSTGAGLAGTDSIALGRGIATITNSGQIGGIGVNPSTDPDGFAPASRLTLINQAGNIGPVSIGTVSTGFSLGLTYDLAITNAAGATIGSFPGLSFGTGLPLGIGLAGVIDRSAGLLRISNAGIIEGFNNGIRFASGDAVITNAPGGTIRTSDGDLSAPATGDGYAIFGDTTTGITAARPLFDNSGTIFGRFGGVNTTTVAATIINRSIVDGTGAVTGGGSIGGGTSGITLGGGSIVNQAGASISTSNVRTPGSIGCIDLTDSSGTTCTALGSAVFFTNPALVGSLDNRGLITSAGQPAILSFAPLSFYNGPTGRIQNNGTQPSAAVEIRRDLAADFVNDGVISAFDQAIVISGPSGTALAHDLINNGTVSARVAGGVALTVAGATARYVNGVGATTTGRVLLSGSQTRVINGLSSLFSGFVENSGRIAGDVFFEFGGDVDNHATGVITRSDPNASAIFSSSSSGNPVLNIRNSGAISATGAAIQSIRSGTTVNVTNRAGGTIIGGLNGVPSGFNPGIQAAGTLTLVNETNATISGTTFGVLASGLFAGSRQPTATLSLVNQQGANITGLIGVFADTVTSFINDGNISGQGGALLGNFTASPSGSPVFRNGGTIIGSRFYGVDATISEATRFDNSGLIRGGGSAVDITGAPNILSTLVNSGTIDGCTLLDPACVAVTAGSSLTINNNLSGQIISHSANVILSGSGLSVDNSGVIRVAADASGDAFALYGGDNVRVVNRAGAEISAQTPTSLLLGGQDTAFFTVENAGLLTGILSLQDEGDSVLNAGTIDGSIELKGGDDRLDLTTTGTITGASSGGDGVDSLRIDTTTGATRTLAEGQFAAFEDIILNPTAGAAGRYVVTAAGDPLTTATLDAGPVGSSITLAQGELNLRDTASSVRAETVSTAAGTLLSGNGTVFGNADVAGTISPGNSVGHLTVEGDLTLAPTALLRFELGAADIVGGPLNDLITVNGSLVLDGQLRVTQSSGGNFAPGVYRLINYSGGLTDNVLSIAGALPNLLSGTVQTAVAGQVNLVIAAGSGPVVVNYWDGPNFTAGNIVGGRGGTAIWNAANTNWTTQSGSANGPWDQRIGVFGGQTGIVTVEGSQAFAGLQFVTDGYHLVTGIDGALDLGTGGFIFVDSGLDTRISVGINGDGILDKQGDGRLLLDGLSSYAGGTTVTAGTLAVGSNTALGAGKVDLAAGTTLQAAANVTLANIIGTGLQAGELVTVDTQGFGLTFGAAFEGGTSGTLRKIGIGTLALSAGGSAGAIAVDAGTLEVGGALNLAGGITAASDTHILFDATARLPAVPASTGTGVQLFLAGANITVDVLAGAVLDGRGGPLIRSAGPGNSAFTLTNAGSITAGASTGGSMFPGNSNPDAIVVAAASGSTIVNSGTISGAGTGAAINFLDSRGADGVTSITNLAGGRLAGNC